MAVAAISFLIALMVPSAAFSADRDTKSAEQQNVQTDINTLNTQLADQVAKYEKASAELSQLNGRIDVAQEELKAKVHELVKATDILDKRAVGIYKRGGVSSLEVIFNSKNLNDFLQQFDLLMRIGSRDGAIVKQVETQTKEVEKRVGELQAMRKDQETKTNDIAFQRDAIQGQISDKNVVLSSIIQDIAAIDAAEAERVAKEKERAGRGSRRGGATLFEVLPNLSSVWNTGSGPLAAGQWSDHGSPGHGVWLGGDAFDMDEPAGTNVYAAHGGIVVSVSYERFGVTIIEGEGYKTCYAHTEPLMTTGQYVSAGDLVGTVASGLPSRPDWYQHLHFELIDNGEAVPAGDYQSYF
jgi:murein DD-endopeptidase MepM/ murein hydrolase activator NlpD